MRAPLALALVATFALPGVARAQVDGVTTAHREAVLDGRAFGDAGAYESLAGTIRFAFDPQARGNRAVVDLALAPRAADGRVHADADFLALQPADPAKRSGTLLLEVSNRGGKAMLSRFCRARGSARPSQAADFGDALLLRAGHTLLWVGWQGDLPGRGDLLRMRLPAAIGAERPIEGLMRANWLVEQKSATLPLGHRDHQVPPPLEDDDPRHALTVRDGPDAERTTVTRESWRFVDDGRAIALDGGFAPSRLYELVWAARDPLVVGLGLCALRDAAAFAKQSKDAPFPCKRVIALGISQSGRLLRHALWQDLHTALDGTLAFDGVLAIAAGAGRGSFNHRFAQPSRDGHRLHSFEYPTDLFPFTTRAQADPISGARDGLVEGRTQRMPRLFLVDGGYEYWGRAAALTHTSIDGEHDVAPLDGERIYAIASAMHFDGALPRAPRGDDPRLLRGHPLDTVVVQRALLEALVAWVERGVEPPPSRYPTLARGELVFRDALAFPEVPGVTPPRTPHAAVRLDFGPRWAKGVSDFEPPKRGAAFPALVPQVDEFGNERGGIRGVELVVPLATYTPWFPHALLAGEPEPFFGGFLPLPRDDAERERTHDPRPSITSLHRGRDEYLARVRSAAEQLVAERFLLEEDVDPLVAHCDEIWRWTTTR
ncbi:MAG: hypothetical protein HZB39_13650 [Planctomycetes bacterium]|nr:hypothetical protein [Planctomycetota bacterium]